MALNWKINIFILVCFILPVDSVITKRDKTNQAFHKVHVVCSCSNIKLIKSCWPQVPCHMLRLLCKFKYWNYSVLNSVRSVKKACHTSDFLLTSYHPESKNLVNLKYKKGHNSGKNFQKKIVIIELDLDIHKIHLHTTPSFNLMLRSQVIIDANPFLVQSVRKIWDVSNLWFFFSNHNFS